MKSAGTFDRALRVRIEPVLAADLSGKDGLGL
jgi:hypothetical protein